MTKKDTKQIISALNRSRSAELGAIMQYMGHHYSAQGIDSLGVKDIFKQSAMDEMRHAELLAERISSLGGIPTLQIDPVKRGGTLKQMLKDDLDLEKKVEALEGQIKGLDARIEDNEVDIKRQYDELAGIHAYLNKVAQRVVLIGSEG